MKSYKNIKKEAEPKKSKKENAQDIISKSLQKIKKAAILFDVKVLDQLILVPNGEFYSFSDNGLI